MGELLKLVKEMRGINIIGKVTAGNHEIELTKTLIYVQKDAKKQATTLLFEEKYTLEDIGVMDRQALIVSEVLTDYAKTLIEQHYVEQCEEAKFEEDDQSSSETAKDTSLMRCSLNYSSDNPKLTS